MNKSFRKLAKCLVGAIPIPTSKFEFLEARLLRTNFFLFKNSHLMMKVTIELHLMIEAKLGNTI